MTDTQLQVKGQEERQADLAPEMHNDEQDDHRGQAQQIAQQAREHRHAVAGGTEGLKVSTSPTNLLGEGKDIIDHMRDMESSGRIDMDAYAGEPNHDDNVEKYGKSKNFEN